MSENLIDDSEQSESPLHGSVEISGLEILEIAGPAEDNEDHDSYAKDSFYLRYSRGLPRRGRFDQHNSECSSGTDPEDSDDSWSGFEVDSQGYSNDSMELYKKTLFKDDKDSVEFTKFAKDPVKVIYAEAPPRSKLERTLSTKSAINSDLLLNWNGANCAA
jgi:hypothetical protein